MADDDNLAKYPLAADLAVAAECPELQCALDRAVKALQSATALFVFTGAGMSVDSGIPDYRGPSQDAQWGENAELTALYQKSTRELSENATWFQGDPEAAWGCEVRKWLSLISDAPPHDGYHIINSWCQRQPHGSFIATSNVDHQHIRSGAQQNQLYAIHGELFGDPSCKTLVYQCSFDGTDGAGDCPGGLWNVFYDVLQGGFDPSSGRVKPECLPRCRQCKRPGRPNYLAFKDDFCRVSSFTFGPKREAMVNWLKGLRTSSSSSLVILEIGCGTVVRNPRNRTEHELQVNPNSTLVRINLHESGVDSSDPRQIAIPLGAKDALLALEARLNWCAANEPIRTCMVGLGPDQQLEWEMEEDYEWESEDEQEDPVE